MSEPTWHQEVDVCSHIFRLPTEQTFCHLCNSAGCICGCIFRNQLKFFYSSKTASSARVACGGSWQYTRLHNRWQESVFLRCVVPNVIISCCRKNVSKEINSHIIGHTKLWQGFSVIEYVCSINKQIFAEALLSRYEEIVRNLTRNSC